MPQSHAIARIPRHPGPDLRGEICAARPGLTRANQAPYKAHPTVIGRRYRRLPFWPPRLPDRADFFAGFFPAFVFLLDLAPRVLTFLPDFGALAFADERRRGRVPFALALFFGERFEPPVFLLAAFAAARAGFFAFAATAFTAFFAVDVAEL